MPTKRSLAVALSKLAIFENPDMMLEQHATDSNVAADLLWQAFMDGMLKGTVVDLGAGTGILAIGAALLEAKVIAVEKDKQAIKTFYENQDLAGTDVVLTEGDVASFNEKGDVVIMNPPFGTKERHADRVFLQKAFELAPVVYSIHKLTTEKFILEFANESGFEVFWRHETEFPLPKTMAHHKKDRERISVLLVGLKKKE